MWKLSIAMLIALSPSTSLAWLADNGLIVQGNGGADFNIPFRGLSAASEFWCAAGDYVVEELHLPPDTLIFRTSSPPRRSGEGMSFSLSRDGAKKTGLVLFSGRRGVSAALARELCRNTVRIDK